MKRTKPFTMPLLVATATLVLVLVAASGSNAAPTWPTLKLQIDSVDATVTVEPSGLTDPQCASNVCAFRFYPGTHLKLTAVNGERSRFVGWVGGCKGRRPTCEGTINNDVNVRAVFTPVMLSYSVSDGGYAKLTPRGRSCGGGCETYDYGSYVVRADAVQTDSTYEFRGWAGDCASASGTTCYLKMNMNRNAYPRFERTGVGTGPLTTTIVGDVRITGGGYVSGPDLRCPSECTFQRDRGSTIALVAKDVTGWRFDRWTGRCTGRSRACTFANVLSARRSRPWVRAWFIKA
jgi:hypothetical protein